MRRHRPPRRSPVEERKLQQMQTAAIIAMTLGVLILVYLAVATTH